MEQNSIRRGSRKDWAIVIAFGQFFLFGLGVGLFRYHFCGTIFLASSALGFISIYMGKCN